MLSDITAQTDPLTHACQVDLGSTLVDIGFVTGATLTVNAQYTGAASPKYDPSSGCVFGELHYLHQPRAVELSRSFGKPPQIIVKCEGVPFQLASNFYQVPINGPLGSLLEHIAREVGRDFTTTLFWFGGRILKASQTPSDVSPAVRVCCAKGDWC